MDCLQRSDVIFSVLTLLLSSRLEGANPQPFWLFSFPPVHLTDVLLTLVSCRPLAAAAAELTLVPKALTVLRGDEAQLTCSTSSSRWTVMVWLLNAEVFLTISNDRGVLPTVNPGVAARQLSPNSWTFILRNTSRLHQGQVTCDLQGIARKTAQLFVQGRLSTPPSRPGWCCLPTRL